MVARAAGERFPLTLAEEFDVVERLPGSASTDFGVPGAIAAQDVLALNRSQADRLGRLVRAAWTVFDGVVGTAPAELRKGPRGGGRDRDKIVEHVLGAEVIYASKVGLRLKVPSYADTSALAAFRTTLLDGLQSAVVDSAQPPAKGRWPVRYAARRIAWHVLDHAWEIEERTEPA